MLAYLLPWVVLSTGCATSRVVGPPAEDGGGFGFWGERTDDFQRVQKSAGLEADDWHAPGEEVEPDDAHALWEALSRTPTTFQSFGPRRTLVFLLRQLITADEDVPYSELLRRLSRFQRMVVMRPDGYLVSAITGGPLQRMGRLELRDGRLMAGRFEVGAFYLDKGGVFYPVDESLRRSGPLLGELGLERDWFNAALDGTEDALAEMALALAHFVTDPIRGIEGLRQLPSAVARLIASSPEYFARYSALPLQEQIREAARLSTHLLTLCGSAAGTVARISSAGTRLPVLSLTAKGALAVERVAVPAGTTVTALGAGAGAVYVLMVDGSGRGKRSTTPVREPGEWGPSEEHMSARAARYQEQVSGRSVKESYWVGGVGRKGGGVSFDGYKDGVLLECKGPGYADKFLDALDPKYWFRETGAQAIVDQARRQIAAAHGVPVRWHVAEAKAANALRRLFEHAGINNIEVVHTPALL